MKLVDEQINGLLRSMIYDQVYWQVSDRLWHPVHDKVWNHVYYQVFDQVTDDLK